MVASSIKTKGFGNIITLTHSYGFSSRYAHLDKRLVAQGEFVQQGQMIGLCGSIRAEDAMTIGSQGSINGRIRGHLVQVAGHFEGEIWCDDLVVFPTSEVAGQVHCRQMVVENGGSFIGQRDQWSSESDDGDAGDEQSSILLASIEPLLE